MSSLSLPRSPNKVRVRILNTTTSMTVHAKYFVEPLLAGHESFNLTTVGYLIENERLGKKVLFDCGSRKDWWGFPPSVKERLGVIIRGLRVEKDVGEILEEKGVGMGEIGKDVFVGLGACCV
jgi:hypothetical protein